MQAGQSGPTPIPMSKLCELHGIAKFQLELAQERIQQLSAENTDLKGTVQALQAKLQPTPEDGAATGN